ncbi:RtcB family protein [Rhizobium sp. MHM7A]|uniref:RtcB family protein n=1 Tax=Rhizobium sp. MHM7A TaxID=2583233 RepID=UPI00148716A6|nr:RtcB family protein [Rhizobium sp. MHM7A]
MFTEQSSAITRDHINGQEVHSVIAKNEPLSQRRRALDDLSAAIPLPSDLPEEVGSITSIATTPDFHAGKPVPVGVVVDTQGMIMPHLVGNDVGCGMHMLVLEGVKADELSPELENALRYVHFQGGRGVALNGRHRHAILRDGLPGLADALKAERHGLFSDLSLDDMWGDIGRTCDLGRFETVGVDPMFERYGDVDGGVQYDAILGSIGGGNHFVEFGVVDRLADGAHARSCGVAAGSVVLVVHSGSLDFGQAVGSFARERLAEVRQPGVDHRVLSAERHPALYARYVNGLANACNIAFVNRFLIALASIKALESVLGRSVGRRVVYDAPHNVLWERNGFARHRKGACPARGPGELEGSPYHWLGEPVILPGSMGDGTWLLKGCGSVDGLQSAAHGAGRKLSRQEARHQAVIPSALRVVGPVDLNAAALKSRPDIRKEASGRLLEEAPGAYRSIDDVVDPMVDAGLVSRVAKIRPILTVKG